MVLHRPELGAQKAAFHERETKSFDKERERRRKKREGEKKEVFSKS